MLNFCNLMNYRQAPLSLGFLRHKYWSGLPFPFPGDLPNPEVEPRSPGLLHLAGGFFTTEPPGKPFIMLFSCSVMFDSSWLDGLQHARLSCPSPCPGVFSNSSPLSQWCHLSISSSVVPFSSCLQTFPASGSFQMNHYFT